MLGRVVGLEEILNRDRVVGGLSRVRTLPHELDAPPRHRAHPAQKLCDTDAAVAASVKVVHESLHFLGARSHPVYGELLSARPRRVFCCRCGHAAKDDCHGGPFAPPQRRSDFYALDDVPALRVGFPLDAQQELFKAEPIAAVRVVPLEESTYDAVEPDKVQVADEGALKLLVLKASVARRVVLPKGFLERQLHLCAVVKVLCAEVARSCDSSRWDSGVCLGRHRTRRGGGGGGGWGAERRRGGEAAAGKTPRGHAEKKRGFFSCINVSPRCASPYPVYTGTGTYPGTILCVPVGIMNIMIIDMNRMKGGNPKWRIWDDVQTWAN